MIPREEQLSELQLDMVEAIQSDIRYVLQDSFPAVMIRSEDAVARMLADPLVEMALGPAVGLHPNIPPLWVVDVMERVADGTYPGGPETGERVFIVLSGNRYLPPAVLRSLWFDYVARDVISERRTERVRVSLARNGGSPGDVLSDICARACTNAHISDVDLSVLTSLVGNGNLPAESHGEIARRLVVEERTGSMSGAKGRPEWVGLARWALETETARNALDPAGTSALLVAAAS